MEIVTTGLTYAVEGVRLVVEIVKGIHVQVVVVEFKRDEVEGKLK